MNKGALSPKTFFPVAPPVPAAAVLGRTSRPALGWSRRKARGFKRTGRATAQQTRLLCPPSAAVPPVDPVRLSVPCFFCC
ncbi:hypothetical protein DESPIG_02536 [Desulfovibrio piger ATCC 29098]|uniref:Uncharacterized protein n=1 Tax=Desulfovibrio piger ATCC 29098 TaxID=411464 RepID=B6WWR7_9BACT|nr:hypothetical protein DESPIG_02536 [Desulfovibrio piger ATCC 29098]